MENVYLETGELMQIKLCMDDQLSQEFVLLVVVGKRKKAATLFEHQGLNKAKMLESIIRRNTKSTSVFDIEKQRKPQLLDKVSH